MIRALYKVAFTEFERCWGSRPDGYILATSKEIAEKVSKEYCKMYNNRDIYSRPNSEPFLVEVDESTYESVNQSCQGYSWFH